MSIERTYEPGRDLITSVNNTFGTNTVSRFDYTNDAAGRRIGRQDSGAAFTSTWTNAFAYNLKSEIEEAMMRNGTSGYEYDPIGNRREISLPEEPDPIIYAANALNQYTSIANGVTNNLSYDLDGNLFSDGAGLAMTWDGENRLMTTSNSTHEISYAYDYMGRRIRKVVDGAATTFVYDGWAMIYEESAAVTNSYVYGLDLSGSVQGAGTVGGLLSANLNGTNAFYCYDANGNVTDLVKTNGTIAAHYEYDPFGRTITQSGDLADDNPFKFSTKYFDSETGLYYYGYRYYNPELGRWPSRDPIFDVDFMPFAEEVDEQQNLYRFVQNTPTTDIDYLGLKSWRDCDPPKVWGKKKGGSVPSADGCSNPIPIPGKGNKDDPTGQCTFKGACDGHDNCYSDCSKSKGDCDNAFGNALQSACNSCASSMPPGKDRNRFEKKCKKWAKRYAWHVKHGIGGGIAKGAYKDRQQANCDCVCP